MDVHKLPRWAQSRIAKLSADLDETNRKLALALNEQPDSLIQVNPYGGNPVHLDNHSRIRFQCRGGPVDVTFEDGGKGIAIYGNEAITVSPCSSNRVVIEPKSEA